MRVSLFTHTCVIIYQDQLIQGKYFLDKHILGLVLCFFTLCMCNKTSYFHGERKMLKLSKRLKETSPIYSISSVSCQFGYLSSFFSSSALLLLLDNSCTVLRISLQNHFLFFFRKFSQQPMLIMILLMSVSFYSYAEGEEKRLEKEVGEEEES